MTGFLDIVAQKVLEKFKESLPSITFVLPGKRAYLLFRQKLIKYSDTPSWEPLFTTFTELSEKISEIKNASDIVLFAKLYNVCKKNEAIAQDDDFDSFISWGEILLEDFKGIDNNLADAEAIFSNIYDLKEIDIKFEDAELNKEIGKTLERHSHPKDTKYQIEFNNIWNKMFGIYTDYRSELMQAKIGYSGMINRLAADKSEKFGKVGNKYIFIGFNTLNASESKIVRSLSPLAIYWDDSNFFDDKQVNEKLNPDGATSSKFEGIYQETIKASNIRRDIEIISCPSDYIQCKIVKERLENLIAENKKIDYDTAIVLADDNLMPVMIQSIPEKITSVNLTTGQPISNSSPYIFYKTLESIIINQSNGAFLREDLKFILYHPDLQKKWGNDRSITDLKNEMERKNAMPAFNTDSIKNEYFRLIFRNNRDTNFKIGNYLLEVLGQYAEIVADSNEDGTTEMISKMCMSIEALSTVLTRYDISVTNKLFLRILNRSLSRGYLPFETEALEGIQITGIMETRCQDFKNLFILSVNDDIIPKNSQLLSFIPMNLRQHYGLPRSGDFQRMSASYFYHLLLRAENIHLLYNSNSSGSRTGEQSRFIRQIEFLSPKGTTIKHTTIITEVKSKEVKKLDFKRTEKYSEIINANDFRFSASMINTYLRCQQKFVLKYLERITPSQVITEKFLPSDTGTAVHNVLEKICEKDYCKNRARELYNNFDKDVIPVIKEYGYSYLYERYPHFLRTAEMDREEKRINIFVKRVLKYDSEHEDFKTIAVEEELQPTLTLDNGKVIQTTMRIDRRDIIGGNLTRIVDYKTGKKENITLKQGKIEDIFKSGQREKKEPILQTLFYGLAFKEFVPAIYSIPSLEDKNFSPYPNKSSCSVYEFMEEFTEGLKEVIAEITAVNDENFKPNEDKGFFSICDNCEYHSLCGESN